MPSSTPTPAGVECGTMLSGACAVLRGDTVPSVRWQEVEGVIK